MVPFNFNSSFVMEHDGGYTMAVRSNVDRHVYEVAPKLWKCATELPKKRRQGMCFFFFFF